MFTDKLCKGLWTIFYVDARSGVNFCSFQFEVVKQAHCHISSTDVPAEKQKNVSGFIDFHFAQLVNLEKLHATCQQFHDQHLKKFAL
jgi:hypothetical protein